MRFRRSPRLRECATEMHVCVPPSSDCGHERSYSAWNAWAKSHSSDCSPGAAPVCARDDDPLRAIARE